VASAARRKLFLRVSNTLTRSRATPTRAAAFWRLAVGDAGKDPGQARCRGRPALPAHGGPGDPRVSRRIGAAVSPHDCGTPSQRSWVNSGSSRTGLEAPYWLDLVDGRPVHHVLETHGCEVADDPS
jgi:hypothetical protein